MGLQLTQRSLAGSGQPASEIPASGGEQMAVRGVWCLIAALPSNPSLVVHVLTYLGNDLHGSSAVGNAGH